MGEISINLSHAIQSIIDELEKQKELADQGKTENVGILAAVIQERSEDGKMADAHTLAINLTPQEATSIISNFIVNIANVVSGEHTDATFEEVLRGVLEIVVENSLNYNKETVQSHAIYGNNPSIN